MFTTLLLYIFSFSNKKSTISIYYITQCFQFPENILGKNKFGKNLGNNMPIFLSGVETNYIKELKFSYTEVWFIYQNSKPLKF